MIDPDELDISLRSCILDGVETSVDRLRLRCEGIAVTQGTTESPIDAFIDLCDVARILCNGQEISTFEMKMPDCEILAFEKRDDGIVVMLLVWTDFKRHDSSTDVYEFTIGTLNVSMEDD